MRRSTLRATLFGAIGCLALLAILGAAARLAGSFLDLPDYGGRTPIGDETPVVAAAQDKGPGTDSPGEGPTTVAPGGSAGSNAPKQGSATDASRDGRAVHAPGDGPASDARPAETDGPPVSGGELRLPGRPPTTLDPALVRDVASAEYVFEIFSGLVKLSPDLDVEPDLARTWSVSPDGRIYTFELRDATFHDGRRLTASDVVYSLERACDAATASPVAATYLNDIVGCEAKLLGRVATVDGVRAAADDRVEITIDVPKAYFLAKLTYPAAFVVDRTQVEAGTDWELEPNGTGPFRLEAFSPSSELVLRRHDRHWSPAYLDGVVFDLAPADPLARYENGELDATPVGATDLPRVTDPLNALAGEVVQGDSLAVTYLAMRVDEPPLDNLDVRRAIYAAIDRERLVDVLLGGAYTRAESILPPALPGYQGPAEDVDFDPAAARKLLQAAMAGAEEQALRITLPGEGGVSLSAEAVADDLEEHLGIEIILEVAPWETFQREVEAGDYQMWLLGWEADYPDPQDFLDVLFHSEAPLNYTGYADPVVDDLLDRAGASLQEAERWGLYAKAERRILEAAPWVPLYHDTETWLVAPRVNGFSVPPIAVPRLQRVWLED